MVSEGWLSVVQLTVSWLERPQSHPEPRLANVYAEGREGCKEHMDQEQVP